MRPLIPGQLTGNITMTQDELQQVVDTAIKSYRGDGRVLESAIGALFIGFQVGWRPLLLMHRHKTISRYQGILDLDFHQIMPEVGPLANKMLGWRLVKGAENFWAVVRGSAPGRTSEFTDSA